ncbi:MAG: glycoside hydrolase family 13 protein [Christensenellaceae bacterium]|jgi:glycosidase
MNEIDFSRSVIHDSTRERYRYPSGAVAQKSTVCLSLDIFDITVNEVYLSCMKDDSIVNFKMEQNGERWTVEYRAPDGPCVIAYWFVIKIDGNNKIYYGADTDRASGVGMVYWSTPPAFQMTIHDKEFTTPNWLKNSIIYQIFPDRFARGNEEKMKKGIQYHENMGRKVVFHENWNEPPMYKAPSGMSAYYPCDYYGGDIQGIIDNLDYLQGMGITLIYLNPIFEAASNHRYNVSDYLKVDPILGDMDDYEQLVHEASQRGIKILLDGVFSHTGDDSVYFNKYGKYDSLGAYQSKESPYYNWYMFTNHPDGYKCWWGYSGLPEINEKEQSWLDYVAENHDSAIKTWLNSGAAGFRLDVVDELPDDTIELFRNEIKDVSQDNILLGEVWENATTAEVHGELRQYALGRGLDSVTNYPFAHATADFFIGRKDAEHYRNFLIDQNQNYPHEMYYALMNMLSSHDTARIHTVLGTGIDPQELDREEQAVFVITDQQKEKGTRLQKAAAAIQFTLPGVPCIYYGDETATDGLYDPFNRVSFSKDGHPELQEYYKYLGGIRRQHDALRTGKCVFYARGRDLFGILRYCLGQKDAFDNVAKDGMFVTLVNRSACKQVFAVDLYKEEQLMSEQDYKNIKEMEFEKITCLSTGREYRINDGLIEVELEPESAGIFEIIWI